MPYDMIGRYVCKWGFMGLDIIIFPLALGSGYDDDSSLISIFSLLSIPANTFLSLVRPKFPPFLRWEYT
jgi:hypothetical protein